MHGSKAQPPLGLGISDPANLDRHFESRSTFGRDSTPSAIPRHSAVPQTKTGVGLDGRLSGRRSGRRRDSRTYRAERIRIMQAGIPRYYTTLGPFAELFREGLPILTYHNLGRRPRGVRLKGLYLSTRLFHRQLSELKEAGYTSSSLDHWKSLAAPRSKALILTFDDGLANAWQHGAQTLTQLDFQAIQFLVAGLLGRTSEWHSAEGEVVEPLMDEVQIREWLAAGHQIGSHTLSHPWLTRLDVSRARREIADSKKSLEDRFGVAIRHFCYPYGDSNERVRDLVAEAGYHTACTTEFGVNTPATDSFRLQRITARYRTRRLKDWWHALSP